MKEVADLVHGAAILRLADPADYDRGRALYDRGSVRIESATPARVAAAVEDGELRRVELRATPLGLEWWCGCPAGRGGAFCLHVVAAAFATWRRAASPQGEPD